jgi:hypothetical protein
LSLAAAALVVGILLYHLAGVGDKGGP